MFFQHNLFYEYKTKEPIKAINVYRQSRTIILQHKALIF